MYPMVRPRVVALSATHGRWPASDHGEDIAMGTDDAADKANHKAEELSGTAKKKAGQAAGNEDLEREGAADETKGRLKQAGDKFKAAFRKK
jgi:uncharacterized protein YjbJ (UPF0337 family)